MHCLVDRTPEFQIAYQQCRTTAKPSKPEEKFLSEDAERLNLAKKGIQQCINVLHNALEDVNAEKGKTLEELRQIALSPSLLRAEVAAAVPRTSEFDALFQAVFTKQKGDAPQLLHAHRLWIAHFQTAFQTLIKQMYEVEAQPEVVDDIPSQPKPTESPWSFFSALNDAIQNPMQKVQDQWSKFPSALGPEDFEMDDTGTAQALALKPEKPVVESKDTVIQSALEIVQLNAYVEQLVAEQNQSVSAIIEDTQENVDAIDESKDQLETAKQAKKRLFHLAPQRMRILFFLLASLLLMVFHTIFK